MDDPVHGNIERAGPDRLEGWCWSPARPGARLTVEIWLDDVPVAALSAGLFRRDLAQQGIGDGRHAFVFHVPDGPERDDLDRAGLIGLRERSTGRVVGRLRQKRPGETQEEDRRLDRLQARLAPAIAAAAGARREMAPERLRVAFAALGDAIAARGTGAVGMAAEGLARRLAPIHVPIVGAPAVSLVLRAADAVQVWHVVAGFAASLAAMRAEMIVVDDGTDPRTALLATLVPNTALVRAAPGMASAANIAAEAARGRRIVWLDVDAEDEAMPPPDALAALLEGEPDCVLLGAAALAAAGRHGLLDLLAPEAARQDGEGEAVLLAIDRDLFARLGGCDAALAGDDALCVLDLALKAALAGHRIVGLPAGRPDGRGCDIAAEAAFRSRWRRPAPLDATLADL